MSTTETAPELHSLAVSVLEKFPVDMEKRCAVGLANMMTMEERAILRKHIFTVTNENNNPLSAYKHLSSSEVAHLWNIDMILRDTSTVAEGLAATARLSVFLQYKF